MMYSPFIIGLIKKKKSILGWSFKEKYNINNYKVFNNKKAQKPHAKKDVLF
jgi:hypothetical protein